MIIHLFIFGVTLHTTCSQYNPTILEDTRSEPRLDGSFGFLYHTEDGITHAAKAVAGGVVQGRFTYTDPTGLKVNFNYNAGSNFNQKNSPVDTEDNSQQYSEPNYPRSYQPLTKPPAAQPQPTYQQPNRPQGLQHPLQGVAASSSSADVNYNKNYLTS